MPTFLTQEIQDIIIGRTLGDLHINRRSYNETTKNTGISSGSIYKYVNNKNLFKDRCYIFEISIDEIENLDLSYIINPFDINL
jgi:hypothetical protein